MSVEQRLVSELTSSTSFIPRREWGTLEGESSEPFLTSCKELCPKERAEQQASPLPHKVCGVDICIQSGSFHPACTRLGWHSALQHLLHMLLVQPRGSPGKEVWMEPQHKLFRWENLSLLARKHGLRWRNWARHGDIWGLHLAWLWEKIPEFEDASFPTGEWGIMSPLTTLELWFL